MDENDTRFSEDSIYAKKRESGGFTVCWARDKYDACKRAFTELRELTVAFDFGPEEVRNDVVAKVTIHMPTDPVVSFECPLYFKLPGEEEILMNVNYKIHS